MLHFLLSLRDFLAAIDFMVSPGNKDRARQIMGDNITIVNMLFVTWWVRSCPKVPLTDVRDLIDGD